MIANFLTVFDKITWIEVVVIVAILWCGWKITFHGDEDESRRL